MIMIKTFLVMVVPRRNNISFSTSTNSGSIVREIRPGPCRADAGAARGTVDASGIEALDNQTDLIVGGNVVFHTITSRTVANNKIVGGVNIEAAVVVGDIIAVYPVAAAANDRMNSSVVAAETVSVAVVVHHQRIPDKLDPVTAIVTRSAVHDRNPGAQSETVVGVVARCAIEDRPADADINTVVVIGIGGAIGDGGAGFGTDAVGAVVLGGAAFHRRSGIAIYAAEGIFIGRAVTHDPAGADKDPVAFVEPDALVKRRWDHGGNQFISLKYKHL